MEGDDDIMRHKLDLYRSAVQHPLAEVDFLQRVYRYHNGCWPTRLREDFAGTCAVAIAWVAMDENHRALAVERHGPTARWAQRQIHRELGDRSEDLLLILDDVMQVRRPKVDVVAGLNFSVFGYHHRTTLRQYLRQSRRALSQKGMLIIDVFGGPGATQTKTQTRRDHGLTYQWEQYSFDPITHRIDCRMHFKLRGEGLRHNVFRYDWRLWSLPEICELMLEAGFTATEVWSADAPGQFAPLQQMAARHEWVAYVVGLQ